MLGADESTELWWQPKRILLPRYLGIRSLDKTILDYLNCALDSSAHFITNGNLIFYARLCYLVELIKSNRWRD